MAARARRVGCHLSNGEQLIDFANSVWVVGCPNGCSRFTGLVGPAHKIARQAFAGLASLVRKGPTNGLISEANNR